MDALMETREDEVGGPTTNENGVRAPLDEDAFSDLLGGGKRGALDASGALDANGARTVQHSGTTAAAGHGQYGKDEGAQGRGEAIRPRGQTSTSKQENAAPRELMKEPKAETVEAVVERCLRKVLLPVLQHMNDRLEGLEHRVEQLQQMVSDEQEVGKMRDTTGRERLVHMEKILREVQRAVQIVRDRAELAEATQELSKLTHHEDLDENKQEQLDEASLSPSYGGSQKLTTVPEHVGDGREDGNSYLVRQQQARQSVVPPVEVPVRRHHDRQHSLDSNGSYSSLQAPSVSAPSSSFTGPHHHPPPGQHVTTQHPGTAHHPPPPPTHHHGGVPPGQGMQPGQGMPPPRTGPRPPPMAPGQYSPYSGEIGYGQTLPPQHPIPPPPQEPLVQPPPQKPMPPREHSWSGVDGGTGMMPHPPPLPMSNGGTPVAGGYPKYPQQPPRSHMPPARSHVQPPPRPSAPLESKPAAVPIEKLIDDVAVMGFSREEVRNVLRELAAQGKAVDMNVVLDRLGAR